MKLFGAAMVRNEADIVEAFVRHNLTVLDGLAIVDHGSFDGTSEILAALVAEGLPVTVTRNDALGFHQTEVTTQLVRDVLQQTSADYVFAIDADEFTCVRSRSLLDDVLGRLPPGLPALVDWQTYVPNFASAAPGDDVRRRIAGAKRVVQERHGLYKVIIGRGFAATPAATVSPGNHLVLPAVPGQSNPHARLRPDVAHLAHVPIRSRDQFTAKIAVGWLATTLATRAAPSNIGFHWREVYEDILAGKELTPERLTEIAVNYSVARTEWRAASEVARVDDPFLADIGLRYTRFVRSDPLALVLAFASKIAAGG